MRALTNKNFVDGDNPIILNTGTIERIFTVAMPSTLAIDEVSDLDAQFGDITNSYILATINVEDAAGTSSTYNVYTMTNAIPYSSNHRHEITRA